MDFKLNRRRFLESSLALIAMGGGYVPGFSQLARADGFAAVARPVLANIMLNGGPDMRHPFVPPFSAVAGSYGRTYWEARAATHQVDNTFAALDGRWNADFFHVVDYLPNGPNTRTQFGILKKCDWLYDMWLRGKVAFMCGTLSDTSRDHDQAIRNMEMGVRDADKLTFGSGWGGRLSVAANGNAVALTTSPRRFTFGPDPTAPGDLRKIDTTHVVPAADVRALGLPDVAVGNWYGTPKSVTRALQQYYPERRKTIAQTSVYNQFFEHERKLRVFGEAIHARLASVPVPAAIEALFADQSGVRYDLSLQVRNLYDALAANDILQMRVASLEFNGWDTHDHQKDEIEPNLGMLFGRQGGLATLHSVLPADARNNLVYVVGGEFGRQLKANGVGTDHGRGTVIIMVGEGIRGGVYGTMFPEEEIAQYPEDSSDIEGRNAIDHVFGAVCERVQPGSKSIVFPTAASAPLEAGVNLSRLFA